jgi:HUS1 checkpoint protein
MLPPLAKMRAVVERMRNLSDVIAVRANSSGRLQLSASTEVVNADITWTNCSHPRIGQSDSLVALLFCMGLLSTPTPLFFSPAADGASQANGGDGDEQEHERADPNKLFSVLVHTRSFLKFLNAHTVSKTTIACKKDPFLVLLHADCLDFKGICQGHCLILFVYIGDSADVGGVLTFYIPSVLDD